MEADGFQADTEDDDEEDCVIISTQSGELRSTKICHGHLLVFSPRFRPLNIFQHPNLYDVFKIIADIIVTESSSGNGIGNYGSHNLFNYNHSYTHKKHL